MDEKFAVEACEGVDGHRPLVVKLADVVCIKEKRSVGLDGCVQVLGDGKRQAWNEMALATRKLNQEQSSQSKRGPIKNNKAHKPAKSQQITLGRKPGPIKPEPGLRKAG